jgi:hypothetical protein
MSGPRPFAHGIVMGSLDSKDQIVGLVVMHTSAFA